MAVLRAEPRRDRKTSRGESDMKRGSGQPTHDDEDELLRPSPNQHTTTHPKMRLNMIQKMDTPQPKRRRQQPPKRAVDTGIYGKTKLLKYFIMCTLHYI